MNTTDETKIKEFRRLMGHLDDETFESLYGEGGLYRDFSLGLASFPDEKAHKEHEDKLLTMKEAKTPTGFLHWIAPGLK